MDGDAHHLQEEIGCVVIKHLLVLQSEPVGRVDDDPLQVENGVEEPGGDRYKSSDSFNVFHRFLTTVERGEWGLAMRQDK